MMGLVHIDINMDVTKVSVFMELKTILYKVGPK